MISCEKPQALRKEQKMTDKLNIVATIFLLVLATGCSTQLNKDGWDVAADASKQTIAIKHEQLGLILSDGRLAVKENDEILELSKWSVQKQDNKLSITAKEPKNTTWEFETTDKSLDFERGSRVK